MNRTTYPFEIGGYQCYVINDDSLVWTADYLIGAEVTQEQLARAALDFQVDPGEIPVSINNLLVSTGPKNVLIDAGSGKRPYRGEREGELLQNLAALEINPVDIDAIIITHSDYDHIGGILDPEGQSEFPNAHYYLSAHSWAYWSSEEGRHEIAALHDWPAERLDFVWGTYAMIQDRLTLVEYGLEFLPGFRLYSAYGHRHDHDVLKIEAAGETLIHLADALLHPLVMADRSWYYTYDVGPEQAIETKERLLEWCVSEEALVFATHFPFPGLGTVQRQDARWRWHPVGE
jgi:glyoxylase-like metal-dependent hydrolase (beta-lactamase superfamily II)